MTIFLYHVYFVDWLFTYLDLNVISCHFDYWSRYVCIWLTIPYLLNFCTLILILYLFLWLILYLLKAVYRFFSLARVNCQRPISLVLGWFIQGKCHGMIDISMNSKFNSTAIKKKDVLMLISTVKIAESLLLGLLVMWNQVLSLKSGYNTNLVNKKSNMCWLLWTGVIIVFIVQQDLNYHHIYHYSSWITIQTYHNSTHIFQVN